MHGLRLRHEADRSPLEPSLPAPVLLLRDCFEWRCPDPVGLSPAAWPAVRSDPCRAARALDWLPPLPIAPPPQSSGSSSLQNCSPFFGASIVLGFANGVPQSRGSTFNSQVVEREGAWGSRSRQPIQGGHCRVGSRLAIASGLAAAAGLHLCETTIHKQFRSPDVAAVAGCEKHHGPRDLIGCTSATGSSPITNRRFSTARVPVLSPLPTLYLCRNPVKRFIVRWRLPQATTPVTTKRIIAINGLPPTMKTCVKTAPAITPASISAPNPLVRGSKSRIAPATSSAPVR